MTVNGNAKESRVICSFRDEGAKRVAMEEIQAAKGHKDLSDTYREATADYIARHLHLLRRTA